MHICECLGCSLHQLLSLPSELDSTIIFKPMKKNILLFFLYLAPALSGCVVDVSEQTPERKASTSGAGVTAVYFDASSYKRSLTVQGMNNGLLTADGIFSLWASGSGNAAAV